jgi:lysophospholipase L1-like esterase
MLAFGDSLTHGTGVHETQSYPAILAQLSGHRVINAGVPGEISAKGVSRLPKLLDEYHPDLLLLCHGGNDMLRQMNLQTTAANIRTMIREARERGIAVLLIGVPRPGLLLGTADFYKEIATEMHVPIEDEALSDILQRRSLKSDRVHPNTAGYRLFADMIYERLKESGAL